MRAETTKVHRVQCDGFLVEVLEHAALYYTPEHQWVEIAGGWPCMGEMVRIGVADFVGKKYGTPHSFQAREGAVGSQVQAGEELAKLAIGEEIVVLSAPIGGRVLAFNKRLREEPSLVARDPYQGGWVAYMEPAQTSQEAVRGLLGPQEYRAYLTRAK